MGFLGGYVWGGVGIIYYLRFGEFSGGWFVGVLDLGCIWLVVVCL